MEAIPGDQGWGKPSPNYGKLKALFILAILGLSAFYLAVLYLGAHPKVSYAYRLYYLDLKTRNWNRNQTLAYVPGTRMDMVVDRPDQLARGTCIRRRLL